ncbi:LysR family transcriptional regulator [Ramlibacter sp.]|uniref:LysR family transcriptional regulator n=1 Tax=Ramlibacter sp. TaxID=1917967 RepID=UPI002D80CB21|nr:LysR family transcriptional regulator [Ramlibacter sp.]
MVRAQMSFTARDAPLFLRLRTRQLMLLAELGAEPSLGRAAAAMNISQPAATKLLLQAEDALGVRLFTRRPRGMEPTAHGEVLIRYARQMRNDFGLARQELQALATGLHGTLRVGSVPGAVPELVAPALAAYQRRHPRVAVSVVVDTSDVMLAQLTRGEVDLMLGRLTAGSHDDEFEGEPLLGEAQVAVVRAGHPLLRQQAISLEQLAQWPWILQPPGSPQRHRFEAALHEAGIHVRLQITETASTILTTALLERSDMAAVMPASLANHYARLGVLAVLPVALPLRVPSIHLITRRQRALSPAAADFRREVSELARRGPAPARTPPAAGDALYAEPG